MRANPHRGPAEQREYWSFTPGLTDAYTGPDTAVGTNTVMLKVMREARKESGASDRLIINIIGKFSAVYRGRAIPITNRKIQALLGYLLFSNGTQALRQSLIGLLWSGSTEPHARGSLRHALHEIHKEFRAISYRHFQVDALHVGFAPSEVDVDLWTIMADLVAGKVHPLLLERDRLADQLFAGLDDIDATFAEWLQLTREATHANLIGALEKLLPADDATTISPDAETAARAIWHQDPDHERSARLLIKARAAANDLGTALKIYTDLWKRLEQDFDIEPSEATQDLVARIRMAQPTSSVTPETVSADIHNLTNLLTTYDARPSIAVLPFRAGSPDVEAYFTSGIVDNVIHVLSSFKELFVIARSSTLEYREPTPDLRAIGRELGVRYILHGTVQRADARIRISTELMDTEIGEVVRTIQHNGHADELFELQDQLAIDVVKAIAPYIRDRELKQAMRKRPKDMNAYQLTLLGYEQMCQLDYPQFAIARNNFSRATIIDPDYATALSYSAIWHMRRVAQEWSPDIGTDMEQAVIMAERALQKDPDDELALTVFGYTQSFINRDHDTALEYLNLALERLPNLPLAWIFKAATLTFAGSGAEAVKCAAMGVYLSPRDQFTCFAEHICGQAHYVSGNFEKAIHWSRRAFVSNPRQMSNLRILVASLVATGRLGEAQQLAKSILLAAPAFDLDTWAARTPLRGHAKDDTLTRLRLAGLGKHVIPLDPKK